MVFSDEQIVQIKESIFKQLDSLPDEQKVGIREKIESMEAEELEEFVKQNQGNGGCIFCSIVEGKSPCFRLGENDGAIAFLELNPVSKGHALVISKKHEGEVDDAMRELAKSVGGKLIKLYSPEDVDINEGKVLGHTVLEVIPNYGEELVKKKADIEELKILEKEINESEILEELPKDANKDIQEETEIIEPEDLEEDCDEEESPSLPHLNDRIP